MQIRYDNKDNVQPTKPHRGRSAKRIDGISAIVTALARATLYAEHESVYEKRGIIFF
jgi:phage terminase large subunit-like protein